MARILVVEDEDYIRDEVMDWLRFEGYEVSGAADGRAGLELARQARPDLIVCDISMPYTDGHEVLIEVRSNAEMMQTPFIFLTASADPDSVRKGMNMGADDYLTKPFTHNDLLNAVRSRLAKKLALDKQVQDQIEMLQNAFTEEREKHLLKTRLIAMFSHDFRNPLTSILSSSGIIRTYGDRLSPERTQQQLDRIDRSVRLLNQMLDDMLLVAEMESGRLGCFPQPLNLDDFVEAIVIELRLIDQNIHRLTLHSAVYHTIEADPKLLRQALVNLIANALKYSARGTEVTVEMVEVAHGVAFSIRDQGIGVPEEARSKLFEPFYRAPNATGTKGSGLGLAIVKQAIELHGGTISVESNQPQGTCFTVWLPWKPVSGDAPQAAGK